MDSGRDSTPASPAVSASEEPWRATQERARVVVADDDPIILESVASLLETRFNVVGRARNGLELLEFVKLHTPAVVVADITMPEMDGIEATRQIIHTWRYMKVVMLSAYSDDAIVEAAYEAGASGYVVKLRAFTDLIPVVLGVLAGQHYCSCHVWSPHVTRDQLPE